MKKEDIGVYIHIPFCMSKCVYCDFVSYAGLEDMMEPYLGALLREIELNMTPLQNRGIKSIYIGGGTPTFYETDYIGRILEKCYSTFKIKADAEISIEANPGTVDEEKLKDLRRYGINRMSIGLQAWQQVHLEALGRNHSSEMIKKEIEWAKDAGFNNLNIDLMFGLPDQDMDEWVETLDKVTDLNVEHISTYSLIVEEDTPLFDMVDRGDMRLLNEDVERAMHKEAIKRLKDSGYEHYEISNFAKPNFKSVHNLIYWQNQDYIGFGCAAHSYINNIRRYNYRDIKEYIYNVNQKQTFIEYREHIEPDIERFESVMMGLRLIEGLDKEDFRKRFGRPIHFFYGNAIEQLKEDGFLEESNRSIYVTSKGMDIHNTILLAFLD
ncbi:MAG: oxygen-independent coproporphyrinogen III oxidase [Clostridiales bacterium]|nr:oxygen-independent coproporphyrinogen III oxidase [Clostridiales bacterium]